MQKPSLSTPYLWMTLLLSGELHHPLSDDFSHVWSEQRLGALCEVVEDLLRFPQFLRAPHDVGKNTDVSVKGPVRQTADTLICLNHPRGPAVGGIHLHPF